MGLNNEGRISRHWEGFRKLWWVVAIILFILMLIAWFKGAYPGGAYCPPKVAGKIKEVQKVGVVPDTVAPLITLNGSSLTHLVTGAKYDEMGAKAIDVIDGNITVTTTGSVDTSKAGEYTVIYKATDAAGNSTTETRKVVVSDPVDATAPNITLLGAATATTLVGNSYTDPGVTAMDDVDGEVKVITTGKVDTDTVGDYILTYTATDKQGNSDTATRTVTVTKLADTKAPVISLNGQETVHIRVGDDYEDKGALATDNEDGNVSVATTGSVNTSKVGEYTLTYSATDMAGNKAISMRKVIVEKPVDTKAPVISLNGQETVHITVGDGYKDKGALATDNEDGNVSVTTAGSVNTSKVGEYTLTYSATDVAGNKASSMRKVIVEKPADTKAPVITLNGPKVFNVIAGNSFVDPSATATDQEDGTISIKTTGSVDHTTAGEYIITYSATDKAGNKASETRTVIVSQPKVVVSKPVARLYYRNNRADNATDRDGSLDAVISYMTASGAEGTTAIVTGFHSPVGNPDYNRDLANRRANDIIIRLIAAGIPSSRISIQQPSVTEGTGTPSEARRVEVYVR